MSLKEDLIAARALITGGMTMTQAIDEVTGDNVRQALISQRSLAMVGHLMKFRPKRKGRAKPSLNEMDVANGHDQLVALFDRAIEAAP